MVGDIVSPNKYRFNYRLRAPPEKKTPYSTINHQAIQIQKSNSCGCIKVGEKSLPLAKIAAPNEPPRSYFFLVPDSNNNDKDGLWHPVGIISISAATTVRATCVNGQRDACLLHCSSSSLVLKLHMLPSFQCLHLSRPRTSPVLLHLGLPSPISSTSQQCGRQTFQILSGRCYGRLAGDFRCKTETNAMPFLMLHARSLSSCLYFYCRSPARFVSVGFSSTASLSSPRLHFTSFGVLNANYLVTI